MPLSASAASSFSELRWRLVTEARGYGSFLVEQDTVRCDGRACELFALPPSQPLATELLVRSVHPQDQETFAAALRAASETPNMPWSAELRTADGTRILACTVISMDGGGEGERGRVTGGVVEDVTAQERRRRALDRAERTRDLVTGAIARDLRSPTSTIVMAADLILHRNVTPEQEPLVGRVSSNARRLAMMIEELVQFVRVGVGEAVEIATQPVDAAALAGKARDQVMAANAGSTIALHATGEMTVTWDATLISGVLVTLLDNAARHGKADRGTIDIDGSAASEVIISVRNDGAIRRERLATLFDLAHVAHRDDGMPGRGLGLGLFNAKEIVHAHGGEISVRSSEEGGTTFSLRLPRAVHGSQPALDVDDAFAVTKQPAEVTAAMFGAAPLHERLGKQYWLLLDRYTRMLETSLDRRTFKEVGASLPADIRQLAEELGGLHASAREVVDLHGRALRRVSMGATAMKSQALVTEGRLLSLELMGHLMSYYRRRAGFPAQMQSTTGDAP